MISLTRVSCALLFSLLLTSPATALEPLDLNGKFDLYAGQIPIGKMSWIVREDEKLDTYFSYAKLRTTGLARLISKQRREMKVAGITNKYGYIPTKYEYNSGTGKKRHVELGYNAKGERIHRINTPEDGAGRPQVTPKESKNSVDPLTALLQLRFKFSEFLKSSPNTPRFSFKIYDGRRLMRGTATLEGTVQMKRQNAEQTAYWLTLTRKPISGFSEKELKKIETEPEPPITVYFSKDKKLIPLMFEIEEFVTISAQWDSQEYIVDYPSKKTPYFFEENDCATPLADMYSDTQC